MIGLTNQQIITYHILSWGFTSELAFSQIQCKKSLSVLVLYWDSLGQVFNLLNDFLAYMLVFRASTSQAPAKPYGSVPPYN
jgi:hypothetical protein